MTEQHKQSSAGSERETIAQALCAAGGDGFLCDVSARRREAYLIHADAVLAVLPDLAQAAVVSDPGPIEAAKKLLINASVGSCTCNTKSPELMWHAPNCRYVTIMMALENVEIAAQPPAAPVTDERAFDLARRISDHLTTEEAAIAIMEYATDAIEAERAFWRSSAATEQALADAEEAGYTEGFRVGCTAAINFLEGQPGAEQFVKLLKLLHPERRNEPQAAWQPIETAPKDQCILVAAAHRLRPHRIAWWSERQFAQHGNGWAFDGDGFITPLAWQPLPDASQVTRPAPQSSSVPQEEDCGCIGAVIGQHERSCQLSRPKQGL